MIVTLVMGTRQSFGLFMRPISLELGFGRELLAFALGLQNLVWGALSPFCGALSDRYGEARVSMAGAALFGLGVVVMGWAPSGEAIVLSQFLIGVGLGGVGLSTVLGAVGRAASPEKRSMALGIVSAAGSVGQFLVVPGSHALMEQHSWQFALFVLSGMMFLVLPLSLGLGSARSAAVRRTAQPIKAALSEAFASRSFILLTVGYFVCGFHVVFIATHLPAYVADKGMPAWVGAAALALVGLFNIVGTYSSGWLGGKYSKKNLLTYIYLARSAVFVAFLVAPISEISVLVFASVMGLLWLSTIPLTSGLVAHLFGPAWMSMLYGIVFFSHQIGSFLGAWLGGKIFDVFGSYDAMWWICIALGLVAAAFNWPIVERPVARLRVPA
ncbi:MAG: MFS transporter [Alphaproteobacteria bacterium]